MCLKRVYTRTRSVSGSLAATTSEDPASASYGSSVLFSVPGPDRNTKGHHTAGAIWITRLVATVDSYHWSETTFAGQGNETAAREWNLSSE